MCCAATFTLFPFDEGMSDYVQSYRKSPNPEAAFDRYFSIDLDEFLSRARQADQQHSRAVLMAFFVHIAHDNPNLCIPFANRLVSEARGEQAAFGAEVLAYGATENRKESLVAIAEGFDLPTRALDTYISLDPFPYPQLRATNWQALDILWASYFASGNGQYIQEIAEPLGEYQSGGPEFDSRLRSLSAQNPESGTPEHAALVSMLTARAAYFGLVENAAVYPNILTTLEALAAQNRGKVSEVSNEIVDQARNRTQHIDSTQ